MADAFRMTRLGDLLNDATLEALFQDAQGRLQRGEGLSDIQKGLVTILEPHRASLLANGVLVEYLAWVLAMYVGRGGEIKGVGEMSFHPSQN